MRAGNKTNSFLNRERVKHVRSIGKKFTSRARRNFRDLSKEQIAEINQTFKGEENVAISVHNDDDDAAPRS